MACKTYFIYRQIVLALMILLSVNVWGERVDSLLTIFKVNAEAEVAVELFKVYQESGVVERVPSFSRSTPSDSLRKEVWYWSGEYYYSQQRYEQAVSYAQMALPLLRAGRDKNAEADCLNLLAISYIRLSDYDEAAVYAKQCYALDKASGDNDRISSSLNTLTGIYIASRQPRVAERYVVKALSLVDEKRNPQRKAVLLGMASEVYHALGNDQLSLNYADEAYRLETNLGRQGAANVRLSQKASALIGLKRYQEAQKILQVIIPSLGACGNKQSQGISCNKMGQALQEQGHMAEAVAYYRQAAVIFQQLGDNYNELHALRGLYESLWDANPDSAKFYLNRFNLLKDSVYSHTTAKNLARFTAEFDTDEIKSERAEEAQAKRRAIVIGFVTALGLLALTIGIWYSMRRRNRQQNMINQQLCADIHELNEKYRELEVYYNRALVTQDEAGDGGQELTAADRELLERIVSVINDQINSGQVDAGTVADSLNMSLFQFRQRLTSLTGETPQSFIQIVRMRRARYLLDHNPELTISQVGVMCAYNDTPNFTRAFKKTFGLTPSQYQEKQGKSTK